MHELFFSCSEKGGPKSNTDSAAAPAATAQVKYACPMKCEGDKTYDQPGKCPMCQMDQKEVK